jgi:hypothetical protein
VNSSNQQSNSSLIQRPMSNTSSHALRENEDLKKRIRDLEKECFQLTYYQQEMQRRGAFSGMIGDPQTREIQEQRNRIE